MAQGYYLFSTSTSNASTQSAIAMAAYRSGEKLYSLKDGETKSFKNRFVEPESFILKPNHAPEWALQRERLWNEVEAFENRDQARLSRNVLVALPNNMTPEQQREMTEEYVQKNFVDHGMVADTSIHRDDENNPHAHIMLTVREFDESGNWETRKSKRVPKLDEEGNQIYNSKGWRETKSVKLNDWDSKKKLLEWRENWSTILNEKSRKFELDRTYSHKSFEEQGRMEKPEIRLTREEYQFEQRQKERSEKKGIEYQPTTFYAKKNEEVKAYNRSLSSVLHLQDYKTEASFNELFQQVKRRNVYDQEKIEATKKITERAKEYVDFPVAKKLYTDFHSPTNKWKQKLERDVHNLNAKKSFIKGVIHDYAEDPSSVLTYGYSMDKFKEEVGEGLQRLEKQQQAFQEEQEKYRELKYASELSLEYQQELLEQEFKAVYKNEHHLSYEEMNYAVQLMKDYQIKLPLEEIKREFEKNGKEKQPLKDPVWKQANDMLFTMSIYNRTLKKLDKETHHLAPEEYKNNRVKYQTFIQLKEHYAQKLSELSPFLDEELQQAFPEQTSDEILKESDVETKSFLLEKYHALSKEEQQSLNLDHFMKEALEESKEKFQAVHQLQQTNKHNFDIEDYEAYSDKYHHIAEGIIGMFQEMSKQRTHDKTANNRDRTKTFRRKGTDGREL